MAIQNEPSRISTPFADAGTKNVIPETMAQPSATAAASWQAGFPTVCSLPLSAGGIPPARNDFNGLFNQITQTERFLQDGGIFAWSADTDYGANRLVLGSDGLLYWSVAQSGPNVGGAQDPTLDTAHTYWAAPKMPTIPADDSSKTAVNSEWVNAWYSSLIVPTDVYVDSVNGDDSNNGFTINSAKKTISAMKSFLLSNSILLPQIITIHVATGSYDGNITGIPGIKIVYSFTNATITGAYLENPLETIYICGTVTALDRFLVGNGALLFLGYNASGLDLTFYNVNTNCALFPQLGGKIISYYGAPSIKIKFSGTCVFSVGTVFCLGAGSCFTASYQGGSIVWSGTPTGKRFDIENLTQISGTGSVTAIPGTQSGSQTSLASYN